MEKVEEELPVYEIWRKIGEQEIEEALFKGLKKALLGDS